MFHRHFILLGALLTGAQVHAARAPMLTVPALGKSSANVEAVYMLNGDIISGKFLRFDPKVGLVWEAKNIKPAIQIDPAGIDRVTFARATPAQSGLSRVLLANGNSIPGQIDLLDDKRVVMSKTPAGRIEFNRSHLKSITPATTGSGRVVYAGPVSGKEWVFGTSKKANGNVPFAQRKDLPFAARPPGNGKFAFNADAITSTGSGATAGREVEFPEKALIEFDLDWSTQGRNSSYFSLNVNLFTDNLKSPSNGNAYSLKLSQTGANLARQSKEGEDFVSDRLGPNARVNLTGIGARARFSLRANKKTRAFFLSINGVQVANWKDKEAFAGKGKGLLFSSRAPYPIKISNIRISEWNGSKPVAVTGVNASPKQDTIRLVNDDTVTGTITRIEDGKIRIKSSFGEVSVPWSKSGLVQFAAGSEGYSNQKLQKGLARATLQGAGNLDFRIISWQEEKLEVESPVFGRVTLNGAMVESINFNPTTKRNKAGKVLSKKELKRLQRDKEKGRGNLLPLPAPNR